MSTDEPFENENSTAVINPDATGQNFDSKAKRAIEILNEALSGSSPKSKNELIREAIRALK